MPRNDASRGGRFLAVLLGGLLAAWVALPAHAQTGVRFDGSNDYVTFGRADSLGLATFTLETWFYREGPGATTTTGTGGVTAVPLLTKGRGEADGDTRDMNFFLGIRGTDSILVADYEEGTGQTSPGLNHPVAGVTPIRSNRWYHAAATFDGTKWQLFLNGSLETELTIGAGRLPQWASLQHAGLATAMQSNGAASGYFLGVLDEPRVWNYARTQTEIRDNMFLELSSGAGLRGRWGLNEGSGSIAYNSVTGNPNGTLTNGPTWVAGTPFAFDFSLRLGSSNAYVTFGNPPELGLGQFTLETWFRRDGNGTAVSTGSGGVTALPLVTKGTAEVDGDTRDMNFFLGIRSSDSVLVADFEEGTGGATPGLNHPIVGTTPIARGAWHHAAATYDGTSWRLYLDGELESELVVGQPPQSSSIQHAALGTSIKSDATTAGFFDGAMDEVRIWNYARSLTEIDSTINARLTTAETGLSARWGLDEGAGTAVRGSAGTSVNGTITGSGWRWDYPAPFDIVIGPPEPPAAPSGLAGTTVSYAEIDLAWTDHSNNEDGFELERSTSGSGGPFTPLDTLGAGTTSYVDGNLAPLAEYCYRVRAVNEAGASDWSNVACATSTAETAHALDFGGTNGYVTFGAAPTIGLAQFTLETWIRRDGAGITANTGSGGVLAVPMITKGVGEADGDTRDMNYFLGIRGTDGVLAADFEEGGGGASPGLNHPVTGITPLQTGVWYHAAVTYDGTRWRLYLNGLLENDLIVGQPPQSASIQHAGLASALNSQGAPSGYLDGVLDEVRIWNYARTGPEIQSTINQELDTPQYGLVARWSLNEGAGSRVWGSAGTRVNGPVTGSAWSWTDGAPFNLEIQNPPDAPILVAPPDGATAVSLSPDLEVSVSDPEGAPLTVSFYGRPVEAAVGEPLSLIMLPDTQYYTSGLNGGTAEIFRAQTRWIVDSLAAYGIAFAGQVGDCVEHGDATPAEWDSAWTAMSLLEDPLTTGLPEGLPYCVTVGNHDQTPAGDPAGTTTGFNRIFGADHFAGRSYYGGHYGANNDNHFVLFSAGGLDFIVLSLEYDSSPDAPVLAWADSLLAAHSGRWAILCHHNLIGTGNPATFTSGGQAVYNALKDNPNLFLMLCGHVAGEGRRSDTYQGHTVHTLMADYQSRANGGDGWLRIMTISPQERLLRVKTYSPTLGLFEADADSSSQFTLPCDLTPLGEWTLVGTLVGVPSGSSCEVSWPGRAAFTEYEWYVTVSDGNSTTTGPVWRFTTGTMPPTAQVLYPNGGEVLAIGATDTLRWTASDDVEVTRVDLLVSRTGAAGPYESIATGIGNTGFHEWTVTGPGTGTAFLKVVAYDAQGQAAEDTSDVAFTISDATSVGQERITEFALEERSGHPFRPGGAFGIAVPRQAHVRLSVVDARGRSVAVLTEGVLSPGHHRVVWNGETVRGSASSGVYFLRLETPDRVIVRKTVLVR